MPYEYHAISGILKTYEEAVALINQIGFLPLGGNSYGYVTLKAVTGPGAWYTGDVSDPWVWKDRIAFEKKAAYAKIAGRKTMFISHEWVPCFYARYHPAGTIDQRYRDGTVSSMAMRIFRCIAEKGTINTHDLKIDLGIHQKCDGSKFELSLAELQENMDITISGASRRRSRAGEPFGWMISEYATVENWLGCECIEEARRFSRFSAQERLKEHIGKVAPMMREEDIAKFLGLGRACR